MIVPALLTDNMAELIGMMDLCAGFTDFVQVDLMDGVFVPSKSVGPADFEGWQPSTRFETHLMVNDPLQWLEPLHRAGTERIIYHFEIEQDHPEVISRIKGLNIEAGIAVNPSTPIDALESILDKVEMVLFMSVNPGFYGAPFIPEVLDKIKAFKEKCPQMLVGIDGGIKLDNARSAREAGAAQICVGSAILKSADPKGAYQEFVSLLDE
jgi:ribulose-phosphate 3-epimerase